MKKFDIYDLVGSYHYKQVVKNPKYREYFSPASRKWTEEDTIKFQQFLKNLEDMSEDKNTPKE